MQHIGGLSRWAVISGVAIVRAGRDVSGKSLQRMDSTVTSLTQHIELGRYRDEVRSLAKATSRPHMRSRVEAHRRCKNGLYPPARDSMSSHWLRLSAIERMRGPTPAASCTSAHVFPALSAFLMVSSRYLSCSLRRSSCRRSAAAAWLSSSRMSITATITLVAHWLYNCYS